MEKIAALLCAMAVLIAVAVFFLGEDALHDDPAIDGDDSEIDDSSFDDDSSRENPPHAGATRAVDEDAGPIVRALYGRVEDRETGRPVQGAIVTLREKPSLTTSSRRSGADGIFRFGTLAPETTGYVVWAEAGQRTCSLRSGEVPTDLERIDVGALRLESSVAIRGLVRTRDGIPIEGASIYLIPHRVVPSLRGLDMFGVFDRLFVNELILASRTTDAQGAFTFERASSGAFAIAAFADGYAGKYSDLVLADQGASIPLEIRLEVGYALEGVVVDQEDRPVAGAELALLSESGRRALMLKTVKTVSGDDGRFRFPSVEALPKILFARAEGFAANAVKGIDAASAEEVRLVMSPGVRVAGRLVDEDSGEGVEGIRVGVMGYARPTFGQATTDTSGRFVITNAPSEGRRYLIVDHPSYDLVLTEEQRAESFMGGLKLTGALAGDMELIVARGGRVKGRVVDSTTGNPLSGVTVFHVSEGRARRQVATRPPRKAETDRSGYFTLDGVPSGPLRLAVQAGLAIPLPTTSGAAFTTIVENWDGRRELPKVLLEVGGPITLSGIVENKEGPVAGARIRLFSTAALRPTRADRPSRQNAALSRTTATDEEGRFTLGPAPRDRNVTIMVTHPDHPDPVRLDLKTGDASIEGLSLKLTRGATLAGRVVDAKGEAAAQLAVAFRCANGSSCGAVTDADGRFRIDGLSAGAGTLGTPSEVHLIRDGGVLLAGGQSKEAVFEMRPAGIVTGRLSADAATNVEVRLLDGDFIVARRFVGKGGCCRLTKVPVGYYTVKIATGRRAASEPGIAVGDVDVRAGQTTDFPIDLGKLEKR